MTISSGPSGPSGPSGGQAGPIDTPQAPASTRQVSPYLAYPDGDSAVEWLVRVFGFGPARSARDDEGRWYEGELVAGSSRIYISGTPQGMSSAVIVAVDDVDALHAHITAAGVAAEPPRDEHYGPRTMGVQDPWGCQWYFWQGEATYLLDGA